MQTVGTDNVIVPAQTCMLQLDPHMVRPLFDGDDLVVEKNFRIPFDTVEQQAREIASLKRHITSPGQFGKNSGAKAGEASTSIIHDAHFLHVVADAVDLADQPHALGQKSMAYPPGRKAGARSIKVGSNPPALSQNASAGPAIPAPEIKTADMN